MAIREGGGTRVSSVMEAIRQRIAGRSLTPGSRLPSIRALAASMRLSASTVVEAYERLAAEGVIVSRPGSGFYVAGQLAPLSLAEIGPRLDRAIDPFLYFKGFQAIQTHRFAHALWKGGRRDFAYYLQSRASQVFQVDIHPAASIGKGIMLDHATGFVVGETAAIGDHCSILHAVTLGGTGKADEDRHPKIGNGVLIGAGAKILGNIRIGDCSRVGAGSVVLKDVPPRVTVAGVPARVIGEAGCAQPALVMDQVVLVHDLAAPAE